MRGSLAAGSVVASVSRLQAAWRGQQAADGQRSGAVERVEEGGFRLVVSRARLQAPQAGPRCGQPEPEPGPGLGFIRARARA